MNDLRLNDNRGLLKYLLLSIITIGIYPLYFFHVAAKEINIACKEDGGNTFGFLVTFLLGLVTGGLFYLVWYVLLVSRMNDFLGTKGKEQRVSVLGFLLWDTIGVLILVGPFIAFYQMLHTMNDCTSLYNNKK
jgi:hypothetical protein